MTHEEAVKVAHACMTADGGCRHCAERLIEVLKMLLPDVKWDEALYDTEGPGQEKYQRLLEKYL